jgi:hypothetical protein
MEDNLNLFCKWMMTSIYFVNGGQPQIFVMEDDFVNGRRPQFFGKWTSYACLMGPQLELILAQQKLG